MKSQWRYIVRDLMNAIRTGFLPPQDACQDGDRYAWLAWQHRYLGFNQELLDIDEEQGTHQAERMVCLVLGRLIELHDRGHDPRLPFNDNLKCSERIYLLRNGMKVVFEL